MPLQAERGICQVSSMDGRKVGLGFVLDTSHVITCAHVVNDAYGREGRDATRPNLKRPLRLSFPIPGSPEIVRMAWVSEWLPVEKSTFDGNDLALLWLEEPVPDDTPVPKFAKSKTGDDVQMWGPQEYRTDGGHVAGVMRGEVPGGRVQIDVAAGSQFRIRPGFSGGPVWRIDTHQVVGIVVACGVESDAADAYALDTETIYRIWRKSPSLQSLDELVARVISAAKYREDLGEAQVEILPGGTGLGCLRATIETRIGDRLMGSTSILIGIVADDISYRLVQQFKTELLGVDQRFGALPPSMLVYVGKPRPELRRWAGRFNIQLFTFGEFQEGYDLTLVAERQQQELADSSQYPASGYVEQYYFEPSTPRRNADLVSRLHEWLVDPEGHLVVVLAPFGYGKTYLMHELARRLHADRFVTPFLFRLQDHQRSHTLNQLAASHMSRQGETKIDLDRFRYLLREGRVALLFDGFDELTARVDGYDTVTSALTAIVEAAEGRAKVVLTSRRERFLTDSDVLSALGDDPFATTPGRRVVLIDSFTEEQIEEVLAHRLGGDREAAADRRRLLAAAGLLGLAKVPRMLDFIADIDEAALCEAVEGTGKTTKGELFRRLLDWWMGVEHERLNPPEAPPGPTKDQLWRATFDLATCAWSSADHELGLADLQASAALLVADEPDAPFDRDQATHMLGSGTLLVRTPLGRFRFVDPAVLEWLVAQRMRMNLNNGAEPASDLMSGFISDFASAVAVPMADDVEIEEFVAVLAEPKPKAEPATDPEPELEAPSPASDPKPSASDPKPPQPEPEQPKPATRPTPAERPIYEPQKRPPAPSIEDRHYHHWGVLRIIGSTIQVLLVVLLVGGAIYGGKLLIESHQPEEFPSQVAADLNLIDYDGAIIGPARPVKFAAMGGEVRVLAAPEALTSWDPAANESAENPLMDLAFRRLTGYLVGSDGLRHLVGDLAVSAGTTSDGRTWTYRLRSGLKFDDGSPVTAADVAYGIARSLDLAYAKVANPLRDLFDPNRLYRTPSGSTRSLPTGLSTAGDDTIVFTFSTPQPLLPYLLARSNFAPVKATASAQANGAVAATGPYTRAEWLPGQRLVLKRNPHWLPNSDPIRQAYPDTFHVELGVAAEAQAERVLAARPGDLNAVMLSAVPSAQVADVLAKPLGERLLIGQTTKADYLYINASRLSNLHIRKALNHLVDRDRLIERLGPAELSEPLSTILPPGVPGRRNDRLYTGGLAAARLEVGETKVPRLTLCYQRSLSTHRLIVGELKADFASAGIQILERPTDVEEYFKQLRGTSDYCDLLLASWSVDFLDGHEALFPMFNRSGSSNFSKLNRSEIDIKLNWLYGQTRRPLAYSLYANLDQRLMADYAPVIPLRTKKVCVLSGSHISHLTLNPIDGSPVLTGVYLRVHYPVNP